MWKVRSSVQLFDPQLFFSVCLTLTWCHNLKQIFKCALWQKAREHVHTHIQPSSCKAHLPALQLLQAPWCRYSRGYNPDSPVAFLSIFKSHSLSPYHWKASWELWWLLCPWRLGGVSRSLGPAASHTVATVQPGTTAQVGASAHIHSCISSVFSIDFFFFPLSEILLRLIPKCVSFRSLTE